MDYTVVKASSPEELSMIEEFVHDNFLPDMPLILAFGMENSPPPRSPTPPNPTTICEDFYLKAVDSQGNIIGVAINRVNITFHTDSETPPEVKKEKQSILQRHLQLLNEQIHIQKSRAVEMVEFMNFVEEEAELNKLPERTIELRVLSVCKEWRQRGVAKRLAEESTRVARDSGFKAMRICCTSEFTARLARSLGWKEHYRLAYKNYARASGKEVYLKAVPPHDHLYYYVIYL